MKGRRFVYLAAGVFAVAGVLLLAGPAGASSRVHATAATNVHCGDTIHASVTLNGDLDCSATSGSAVTIDTSGVTFNLGGYTITANTSTNEVVNADWTCGSGSDRCDNVTVTNGTITGGYIQVGLGGDNNTASGLTLKDPTDSVYYGVYLDEAAGSNVTGNNITGADYNSDAAGVYDDYGAGNSITSNTIGAPSGVYNQNNYYGIYIDNADGDTVGGNYVRRSWEYGIYDYEANYETYVGNVVTGNSSDGMYLEPDGNGQATVSSNAFRSNGGEGLDVYECYNSAYNGTANNCLFSGNSANYNGDSGFYDDYSWNASWTQNSAQRNATDGFFIYYGDGGSYTYNTAKLNAYEGFEFYYTYGDYAPLSIANNQAWYNGDYGFYVDEYAAAGSGNTGSSSNASGDCYGLSGCS